MSIWRISYLLYGFRLNKKSDIDIISNHSEELFESKPYSEIFNVIESDQVIIEDCMCSSYVYIGINIADVSNDEYCEISDENLLGLKDRLLEYMKTWPDYLVNLVKDKKPELYMFNHAQ